jgi:hypothetical protein
MLLKDIRHLQAKLHDTFDSKLALRLV